MNRLLRNYSFWILNFLFLQTQAGQFQKPNIIFIMCDDHGYRAISAYNGGLKSLAPTPNIDRIAINGMRFNRCLVTNSLCGPAMSAVFMKFILDTYFIMLHAFVRG